MKNFFSITLLIVFYVLEEIVPFKTEQKKRLAHTINNASLSIINGLLNILFIQAFLHYMTNLSADTSFGPMHVFIKNSPLEILLSLMLFDLWMYAWHRANHKIAFLWRFHQAHHNDTKMDVTTALRFHPIEILISGCLNGFVLFLLGINFETFLIYSLVLHLIIYFHHSNLSLPKPMDDFLRLFIVTPNMHKVHHSLLRKETDSNFSSVFSWWDRLFYSHNKREDTQNIIFGLRYFREDKFQKALEILKIPFMLKK